MGRKHFAAISNIKTRERCRAHKPITTQNGARVTGVSCLHADGTVEEIQAHFVIDANSNGQLTLNLLSALGLPAPEETTVGVELGYSTTVFEIPHDAPTEWRIVGTLPHPPRNRRGALLVPVERNCWIVSLGGSHDCKPPDDEAGFLEFARQLLTQTIYNAIKGAKRCAPISRYGFKASRWRHFEKLEKAPRRPYPLRRHHLPVQSNLRAGNERCAKEACLLRDLLTASAAEGTVRM